MLNTNKIEIYKAIILFGVVSLIGDIIYEGARALTPSYLESLGVSIYLAGLVFGFSEFLNLSTRLVSGVLVDKLNGHWLFYALGYLMLISVPLIGFSKYIWMIIILILIERIAKALRSPARDTLISLVSKDFGTGKAFGFHELLDQIGGVAGPASLGVIMLITNSYFISFGSLFLPYIFLVFFILYIKSKLRVKTEKMLALEASYKGFLKTVSELPAKFKFYILAVMLNTMGLIHWSLILYSTTALSTAWITAILYMSIQGIDALIAPISGHFYDKYGKTVLTIPFLLSIVPSILTVLGGWGNLIISGILFGVIYGMQESIYRAAVADLVTIDKRGTAYGLFNSIYGIGLLLSGAIFGYMMKISLINIAIIYSIIIQIIALYLLFKSL